MSLISGTLLARPRAVSHLRNTAREAKSGVAITEPRLQHYERFRICVLRDLSYTLGLGGGMVIFILVLTTEYDPTHVYGVENNIGTLANTRLSCIYTSYPKMFTPLLVLRQSIWVCL